MAVLQLSKKFTPAILEKACDRALAAKKYNFSAIQRFAMYEHDLRLSHC